VRKENLKPWFLKITDMAFLGRLGYLCETFLVILKRICLVTDEIKRSAIHAAA